MYIVIDKLSTEAQAEHVQRHSCGRKAEQKHVIFSYNEWM
jgi:hypothetical protein